MSAKKDDLKLLNRKLGHANHKLLYKLSRKGVVRGNPMLENKQKTISGDFHVGKQTRATHSSIREISITHVLELMHVDLFGPTQADSIERKAICSCVCKCLL